MYITHIFSNFDYSVKYLKARPCIHKSFNPCTAGENRLTFGQLLSFFQALEEHVTTKPKERAGNSNDENRNISARLSRKTEIPEIIRFSFLKHISANFKASKTYNTIFPLSKSSSLNLDTLN